MVEGAGHVGDPALAQQREERPKQAAGGAHLGADRGGGARGAEVRAEQLVGAVDQVNAHAPGLLFRATELGSSRSRG